MLSIIWTEEALQDLNFIHTFLAEKSNQAAQKTVSSIFKRTRQLNKFPLSRQIQLTISDLGFEYRYCRREL